jgi:predicted RNA-binding Zn ribbon-like protein
MSTRPVQWPGDDEPKPAPEPLTRVQALVNTVELPDGSDRLASHADAVPWLVDNHLLAPQGELADAVLDLVRGVREALRALLVQNAGGPMPTATALAPLRDVASTGMARACLADDGEVRLTATGDSVRDRLVDLLLIVRDAQRDGTWALLKACANDECQWAFYDKSRNHGGTWCEMSACGNKLKNRAFRARSKTQSGR